MEILIHLRLMFEHEVHVLHRHEDPVFSETLARLLGKLDAVRLGAVDNDLKASGIDKLFDVLEAVDVAARACLDLHVTVDVLDRVNILLMLLIIVREIKNDNLVNSVVIVKLCQLDDVRQRGVILNPPYRLSVL